MIDRYSKYIFMDLPGISGTEEYERTKQFIKKIKYVIKIFAIISFCMQKNGEVENTFDKKTFYGHFMMNFPWKWAPLLMNELKMLLIKLAQVVLLSRDTVQDLKCPFLNFLQHKLKIHTHFIKSELVMNYECPCSC